MNSRGGKLRRHYMFSSEIYIHEKNKTVYLITIIKQLIVAAVCKTCGVELCVFSVSRDFEDHSGH